MSRKIDQKIVREIQALRKKGWSLPEIQSQYHIGYGTIHRYIKDISIDPSYKKRWLDKFQGSKKRKETAMSKAYDKAKKAFPLISKDHKTLFVAALYWGQGSKSEFELSSADPEVIGVFLKGLTHQLGISEDDIKLSLRIYQDQNKDECLIYWSKITGMPIKRFSSVNILKGKKRNVNYRGLCRVRVRKSADLLKYMQALKSRIIEQF